ncbi:PREDICTED: HIV Tat-specific factor 1 homolog [Chrysochloris asiatica]|uniref:17S U2 SnRNP complex component HTATSF1 n=1 Tax=Chrysochloris asiatica TaxID=185453 RepID=A0A9B0U769_CHRAS|nr:PREDICTED: HIV Tat-specific factor 1 homolog [Chrysochloris asiatica]
MSGGNLSENEEFDEQLRMPELYGEPKEGDLQENPSEEAHSLGQQSSDTPYEWDMDKKAWFRKITEDFTAPYQASCGFPDDGASSSTADVQDVSAGHPRALLQRKPSEPTEPKRKGEKRKAESGWFHVDEDRNTNVYVSGLPPDITVDEFIQLMSRFGIIMRDPQTEEFKVKLYKDNQGNLKGDGLCCYLKRESVELALKLLDEDEIRGYKLHVEVAKFQLKGEYDASKKKKCKDYKKKPSMQQKQLDWRPERKAEPSRKRHEQVVIIKNMFQPTDFEDDPLMLNEIREDLRVACLKFGQIKKLILFDKHPDGVASVSFRDPEEADTCIQTLDGRWFGGRQVTAEAWDGTTDYQVEATTREREQRLKGWETFLNEPDTDRGGRRSSLTSASERAGPSRVRQFSEHSGTSQMNATADRAFEAPQDEKKFENPADGEESEEEAAEKAARESSPSEESEDSSPEKESEDGGLKRGAEEACLEWESEEGRFSRESEENGSEREPKKKKLKKDYEENGFEKEPTEDSPEKDSEDEEGPPKESEEDSERESEDDDGSENQWEEDSEKELEENGLEKDTDESDSEKEFEDILEKELEGSEKSEFEDDGSEKVFEEEDSERESEEDSDENEDDDTYEKVFDDESNEADDEGNADEQELEDGDADEEDEDEEDEAEEKLFQDSDEKEDEEDIVEKLFDDDDSDKLFDEDSTSKMFESDEMGTLGYLGTLQEEDPLSTGSSFVLSSDDDEDDDD